jgi:eukaryotic-like serine/threonine-protein kinase
MLDPSEQDQGQYQGRQFGNYRLVKLLGEGGFAEVYLGEHVYLGTQAAVKVLISQLTDEGRALFRDEARMVMSLEHPNIVRVYDFGIESHIPFIVMSYAPNGTLRKLYPRGSRLPLQLIVSYVKQIAFALQSAHDQKLIHRDIKPDNLLVGRNGEILLSDFGLALVAHSTHSMSTHEESGTISYMAPEQMQGRTRIASDQYALGVVVYEWLSGTPPFTDTALEIGMQHLLASPPSLREKVPAIPKEVEQVVLTALAKDPTTASAVCKLLPSPWNRLL